MSIKPASTLRYEDYKIYVDDQENHCPFCKAPGGRITRNIVSSPRTVVIAHNLCRACSSEWDVTYTISSITVRIGQ